MGFQSTVNFQQGFGIPGELFDDGPYRAEPAILNTEDPTNNVFGRVATWTGDTTDVINGLNEVGIATMGGTGVFAGFLVNPKAHASFGTTSDALAPTLTLPNNSVVELLNMGSIIVSLPDSAAVGDLVCYDNVTGDLTTITPGSHLAVGTSFAHAVVDRFPISDASLAVIRVTDVPVTPTLAPSLKK